jgi:hypothetical protein
MRPILPAHPLRFLACHHEFAQRARDLQFISANSPAAHPYAGIVKPKTDPLPI